ncbi:hypothetical protein Drorol1_Dr00005486 [Drosera rotundifolia]
MALAGSPSFLITNSTPWRKGSGDSRDVKLNIKAASTNIMRVAYGSHDHVQRSPSSLSSSARSRGSTIKSVPYCTKQSGPSEEDHTALETVLRLYSALKRRDIKELSDVIGDECRCISNFLQDFKPLRGKQEVMKFFTCLTKTLKGNIDFIVQPILQDGMHVGVAWTLECNKTHAPLGKGFSFHICHIYRGKIFIRNVEILMEPIFHMEPLRLMLARYVVEAVSSTKPFNGLLGSKRALYMLLSFLLMAASLYFLKHCF